MQSVSVVIPAYNAARFILEAVQSVLAQTVSVAEIIVVDDGSDDDLATALGPVRDRVQLVRQPNSGPAAARNRGIALAASEWIAFLDADDVWLPAKLAEQTAALSLYPDVPMIASDMAEVDVSGTIVVPSVLASRGLATQFEREGLRPIRNALSRLLSINFIPTGTVLARRDVLLDVGAFPADIRYGEDLALWAAIAAQHPIMCLPTVHMLRRKHDSNATHAGSPLYLDLARVVDRITRHALIQLKSEGALPARIRAQAWADAAYSLFTEGHYRKSRNAAYASLRAMPNCRALRYLIAGLLPHAAMMALRNRKESTARASRK